jgi:hypothetical protein
MLIRSISSVIGGPPAPVLRFAPGQQPERVDTLLKETCLAPAFTKARLLKELSRFCGTGTGPLIFYKSP